MGLLKKVAAWVEYAKDLMEMKRQLKATGNPFRITNLYPIVMDRYASSGTCGGAYFYQDLLVAQKIFQNNPNRHVDVGSRVDGFIAHVAAFREIEVIDIRPADNAVTNVRFVQADFMGDVSGLTDYCDSISSLHAFEHFGLGRYGDPVDAQGYIKALNNIDIVLKAGGKFYFSVPIGDMRIEFNAHRIFSIQYLKSILELNYKFDSFAYVDDRGQLHMDANLFSPEADKNFNCREGCGIFELTKIR